jgi:HPt (histidine-containing phosphotransfer) domain-containing protein
LLGIVCTVLNYKSPLIMDYKFINMEYLDSISGGDPEVINEILTLFKDQAIEIYNDMRSHLSGKNYHSLGLLAHKAKSSVAIMGMNDLVVMLKKFELLAKEGKESELYDSFITRFKLDTEAAVNELEDMIKNRLNKG